MHDNAVTAASSDLRNPIPHRPRAHYANYITHLVHLENLVILLKDCLGFPRLTGIYRSIAIATAFPPPRHNATIPRRASRLFNSYNIVVNNLDPDCPIAWPNATAPPFTLTFSGSSPSSRVTATAATENASFNSTRSTSLPDQPVFFKSFRTASTGAIITRRGSTPDTACATIFAIGSTPSSRARRSDVTTTADAPSFTLGALPAVTVPPSLLNAGLSFPSTSTVVSSRTV